MLLLPCRAFADSKTLNEEQREALFADIRADGRLGYAIESVSAAYISARMLRRCCLALRRCHIALQLRAWKLDHLATLETSVPALKCVCCCNAGTESASTRSPTSARLI